jgi:type VI secretion system Hcp family effector
MNAPRTLLVFAITLLSTNIFAAEFFLKVTGVVQGKFKGENAAGQIPLIGYNFQVNTPTDASTGQPTGRRRYEPITVTKNLDLASPQLLQALVNNETLSTVTIQAYNTTKDGKISAAYSITLGNAVVVGLNQSPDSRDVQTEQISFTFQTITVKVADLTATDDF